VEAPVEGPVNRETAEEILDGNTGGHGQETM